jgi:hypothetical protein
MITKIKNSLATKIFCLTMAFNVLAISTTSANDRIIVNAGTPIILETISSLKSDKLTPGQLIDFKVKYDIIVGDKVVIPAGTIAKGQITRSQIAKGLGKPGYIEVQVSSVTATDGSTVPLTGGNMYQEGEERQTEAIILGVLICILFLTIKGTNAEIPIGTQVNAISAGTVYVDVK